MPGTDARKALISTTSAACSDITYVFTYSWPLYILNGTPFSKRVGTYSALSTPGVRAIASRRLSIALRVFSIVPKPIPPTRGRLSADAKSSMRSVVYTRPAGISFFLAVAATSCDMRFSWFQKYIVPTSRADDAPRTAAAAAAAGACVAVRRS